MNETSWWSSMILCAPSTLHSEFFYRSIWWTVCIVVMNPTNHHFVDHSDHVCHELIILMTLQDSVRFVVLIFQDLSFGYHCWIIMTNNMKLWDFVDCSKDHIKWFSMTFSIEKRILFIPFAFLFFLFLTKQKKKEFVDFSVVMNFFLFSVRFSLFTNICNRSRQILCYI